MSKTFTYSNLAQAKLFAIACITLGAVCIKLHHSSVTEVEITSPDFDGDVGEADEWWTAVYEMAN